MPNEKGTRKDIYEITDETEDKKDDVKSGREEEIEDRRANLKSKIKENLKKAIDFQTEIKQLTGKTLEGLEKMDELSKMLEELYHQAEERVESLEKDLEENTSELEGEKAEEESVDFEQLLSKAKEIKELLRKPDEIKPDMLEEEKEEKVEEEGAPEEPEDEEPEERISPLEALDKTAKMEHGEHVEMEPMPEEKEEPDIREAKAEEAPVAGEEEPAEEISPLEALDETIKIKPREHVEMEPVPEEKEEPTIREVKAEEAPVAGEEEPAEEISPLEALDETIKIKPRERVEMEPVPEEEEEPAIREAKAEEAPVAGEEEPSQEISPLEALDETIKIKPEEKLKKKAEKEEERGAGDESAQVTGFPKRRASDALEILEKYKKTEPEEEAEVVYYENVDKKILDSECIVSAVCNRLEEAEKLYKKLTKTESPIDQFFVKQEIIRSQEALRGVILAGTRMLEKESSTLPQYTIGVVNIDVLKEILEKLSMQNWSKKTDFRFFMEYAAKLKRDYYARISSLVDYLKSLIEELGLEF